MLKVINAAAAKTKPLTKKQEKLDLNDNGKIDAEDLKGLREGKTKESSALQPILARLRRS